MKKEKKPILLEGDLGKTAFNIYYRKAQYEYGDNPLLKGLQIDNSSGIVRNANTYALALLNEVLSTTELSSYRLVRQGEVEELIRGSEMPFVMNIQTGILVTSNQRSESEHHLRGALEEGIRGHFSYVQLPPVVIPMPEVFLGIDKESPTGMTLKHSPGEGFVIAPQLDMHYDGYTFKEFDSRGLPLLDMHGKRILHTCPKAYTGLYKVHVENAHSLYANDHRLEHAERDNVVLVVKR
ncbi:hypothetical protein C4573_03635 [Candidatus Woesearchaeota archaeon]|nr:MAG: hypothetical protein C4573_03635 [Candidatus Woesearchaeota archaeon]